MASERRATARLAPEVSTSLGELDRLARERPELEAPARTLARVLAAAFDGPTAASLPLHHDTDLRDAWLGGTPLFQACPPRFDTTDLRRRALGVLRALGPEAPQVATLMRAIDAHALDIAALIRDHIAGVATIDPEPPGQALALSLARLVALPSLAPLSTQLASTQPPSAPASLACPLCGADALLAEARGLERSRILRCAWCAAAWPGPRLGCPGCGTRDAAHLSVYHVQGESERCGFAGCRRCGLRLRIVNTLGPLSAPGLLVAELATMHLDLIDPDPPDTTP